jgi:hypothetical protein
MVTFAAPQLRRIRQSSVRHSSQCQKILNLAGSCGSSENVRRETVRVTVIKSSFWFTPDISREACDLVPVTSWEPGRGCTVQGGAVLRCDGVAGAPHRARHPGTLTANLSHVSHPVPVFHFGFPVLSFNPQPRSPSPPQPLTTFSHSICTRLLKFYT